MAILYTLKRFKRSKSLKIKIRTSGEIIVTAPLRLSTLYIKNFIEEQTEWIKEKLTYINSLPQSTIKVQQGDYEKYKKHAREIVCKKIEEINSYYKFDFKRVTIRNQKTRWGSCSNKKTLSFNYKIVHIPDTYITYIVTHELCHLKEMNHGPKFWKLIEETIPDYVEIQEKLKKIKI